MGDSCRRRRRGQVRSSPSLRVRDAERHHFRRYAAILASQKKTEDGLQRFQKRQQGMSFFRRNTTAPAEDATPDDSKVKLQMQLDIDALGKDAMTLGVDVAESQAFEALRSAIVDSAEEKK